MSGSAEDGDFEEEWRLDKYVEKLGINGAGQLGLRLTAETKRVTMVESGSSLAGLIFVGDRVVAVDGEMISSGEAELRKKLWKDGKSIGKTITIEHGIWSHSQHKLTTIERDKDSDKLTGRAINIYRIEMYLNPDSRNEMISQSACDLHVRYDARERLCISSIESRSLSAVHLRPGDIIRQVNRKNVASKTMLRYHLISALKKDGRIELLIEAGGGEAPRTDIEMASDVLAIAERHRQFLLKKSSKEKLKEKLLVSALTGPTKSKQTSKESKDKFVKNISIAPKERSLVNIASDYDMLKLRPVKGVTNKF